MTVGENIRKIRKEKGLTQKQLGELCNPPISESNIRKYELGNQNPKIETIRRITVALGVYISDLVDDWTVFSKDEISENLDNNFIDPSAGLLPDNDLENAWDDWIHSNNIHFMSWKLNGINGMLITFTDTNESYFLTREQAKKLPDLSIEQVKILIKAMGKENFPQEDT